MENTDQSLKKTLLLSLGALGVVFGDIGTSPLYAIKEIVLHLGEHGRDPINIFGYISLVIWSLLIVIAFKYIVLVLKADNEGEGGVFALYALLSKVTKTKRIAITGILLLLAVGMLFGDGIITPAISVISAIEGLAVITNNFDPYIIPITIVILTALFAIQHKGTSKIGHIFGPIITVWFTALAILGISHIIKHPEIFAAFNPIYAIQFLMHHDLHSILMVLGSVMLVITGGEALYADMGHFGRLPIKISWFSLTMPALILNYLGQGAFLLSDAHLINHNVFYSMAPSWALTPMVMLATAATIIASQALITGAFSLATQGISLGLIPILRVMHTHEEHEGQIYVPSINSALYVGCIILVLLFRSSSNLASAYGLAVSSVMLITTLSVYFVAIHKWKWNKLWAITLFGLLGAVDLLFLIANSLKLFQGGYIPLIIGMIIVGAMLIWRWGKEVTRNRYDNNRAMSMKELIDYKNKAKFQIPRSLIATTQFPPKTLKSRTPLTGEVILDRYGELPYQLVFLTVKQHRRPYIKDKRCNVTTFYDHPQKGSILAVTISYGFMETPNVEDELIKLAQDKNIPLDPNPETWMVHVIKERFYFYKGVSKLHEFMMHIYKLMYTNSKSTDQYFGLGRRIKLSIEILPVKIK